MIITSAERPNAWVGDLRSLDDHIERFFRDARGEIWTYETQLAVLTNEDDFAFFYIKTIAGLGRTGQIRNVKLALTRETYQELFDPQWLPAVRKNLARYPSYAPPIWVGSVESIHKETNAKAPQGIEGVPWVLCVESGHLVHRNAIAVRLLGPPLEERAAVTWPITDRTLVPSNVINYFNQVFHSQCCFHKLARGGNVQRRSKSLLAGRGGWQSANGVPYRRRRVLVIIALDEEIDTAIEVLNLTSLPAQHSYWYTEIAAHDEKGDQVAYSVLVRSLPKMGNTDSAVQTMVGLQEFNADVVVLLGIAGGIGLRPPTVVVATEVHAYEYATVKKDQERDQERHWKYVREARTHESLPGLREGIIRAKRLWKQNGTKKIMKRKSGDVLRASHVELSSQEKIASGSKKSRCQAFSESIQGRDKKINAIEMEGEGLGYASCCMKKPFVIIKGVSDCADETTQDDSVVSDDREAAARAAASFFMMMLKNACL